MTVQNKTTGEHTNSVPFDAAEQAWFWFVVAQQARNDGARIVAGNCVNPRPCEPVDILNILGRLHRNRVLSRDHLLVLRHYGRRGIAPDLYRIKEARAFHLWHEAMEHFAAIFLRKGIIDAPSLPFSHHIMAGQ